MTEKSTEQASLYERLGGYDAISKFAAQVIAGAMRNPVIGHYWDHASEDSVFEEHINFVDWLSAHWGGEARYRGRDLVTTHRGMGITEEHWDALFEVIEECYDANDLAPELRAEVDSFLRRFKPAIVGSPSFRQVVMDHPDIDITEGMKSVGIRWPASRVEKNKPERVG
ncbi:group I truncated hemoglobin [Streptomyces shenzhenensis]|uniref:group I truncated hemoglobin n=1 Tax=Streptomyces shenzhenensis TaxID=943815 RepID=UPI0033DDD32B